MTMQKAGAGGSMLAQQKTGYRLKPALPMHACRSGRATLMPFALFFFTCLALILFQPPLMAAPPESDAILIRSASVGPGTAGKADGAILITDKEEIVRLEALFLNNRQEQHACGYHYDIEFWSGSTNHTLIEYNTECGERFERHSRLIAERISEWDSRFKSGSVNSLHALRVPVSEDPEQLLQHMRAKGLYVYPYGSMQARYPSLTINFTHSGPDNAATEEKARSLLRAWLGKWPKNRPQPIRTTSPVFSEGRYHEGRAEIITQSVAWFHLGTDLHHWVPAIEGGPVSIRHISIPTDYLILLVTSETEPRKIEAMLADWPAIRLN